MLMGQSLGQLRLTCRSQNPCMGSCAVQQAQRQAWLSAHNHTYHLPGHMRLMQ